MTQVEFFVKDIFTRRIVIQVTSGHVDIDALWAKYNKVQTQK